MRYATLTLVGVLIKTAKCIDLIVSHVCHTCIDQACRPCSDGGNYFRLVVLSTTLGPPHGTSRHEESVVAGRNRGGRAVCHSECRQA